MNHREDGEQAMDSVARRGTLLRELARVEINIRDDRDRIDDIAGRLSTGVPAARDWEPGDDMEDAEIVEEVTGAAIRLSHAIARRFSILEEIGVFGAAVPPVDDGPSDDDAATGVGGWRRVVTGVEGYFARMRPT